MKIESIGKAPSGKPVLTLRLGGPDLGIIEGLLETALKHTPKTADTAKTIQRMQAMKRCFNSSEVQEWIDPKAPQEEPAGDHSSHGFWNRVAAYIRNQDP